MKIAVWHNLPSGGGKRALYHHVRGLVARGHEVEAWCPPTADQTYLPLSEMITEHVVPIEQRTNALAKFYGKFEMLRREVLLPYDQTRRNAALDEHCRRCAEEINRGNFDLLFANASLIQAVSPIARYVHTHKVLYLQEPNRGLYEVTYEQLPWVALPSPGQVWRKPRYVLLFLSNALGVQHMRVAARDERANAAAFDLILANSYFSRESMLRAYGLSAKVCYLGIDTEKFVNLRLPREDFVVSVGQFLPHKNAGLVIEALALMPAPRPRLIWVANSSATVYYQEMRKLADSRGVSLELKVGVDDTELVDILNRGAAMIYAPRLEPFGFAPLEANACGMPVVSVAEGGVRETIIDGENGLLVGHDPQELADALSRLLGDLEFARHLGEKASSATAIKWSWDAALDRLEEHFAGVIATNGAPSR
jgi:glycosyltransferase involved in cell wall biosynthesis